MEKDIGLKADDLLACCLNYTECADIMSLLKESDEGKNIGFTGQNYRFNLFLFSLFAFSHLILTFKHWNIVQVRLEVRNGL